MPAPPQQQIQNRDLMFGSDDHMLQYINQQDLQQPAEIVAPKITLKKKVIKTTHEDGFFKTGVDVQEHEEYEFEGSAQQAAEAYKQG